jgi:hypothetical protein
VRQPRPRRREEQRSVRAWRSGGTEEVSHR